MKFFIVLLLALTGCSFVQPQFNEYDSIQYESSAYEFVTNGWKALKNENYEKAASIADDCVSSYSDKAKSLNLDCEIQDSPTKAGKCGLLNDVGQCLFIKAKSTYEMHDFDQVKIVCSELNENYFNSWVDSKGWPWKPSVACDFLLQNSK